MNILLIEASQKLYEAKGKLNHALFSQSKQYLVQRNHSVAESCVNNNDWNIQVEISKLRQADLVIYHFPLWWFGVPNSLKRYFDEVLVHGETFGASEVYGEGGLLIDKKFMLVVTSNLDKRDFENAPLLMPYKNIDHLLTQVVLTNRYIGIKEQLPTFHADNVIKGDTTGLEQQYRRDLEVLDL